MADSIKQIGKGYRVDTRRALWRESERGGEGGDTVEKMVKGGLLRRGKGRELWLRRSLLQSETHRFLWCADVTTTR